jgi:hypothetical protein
VNLTWVQQLVDTTKAVTSFATGEFALGSEACATATAMVGNSFMMGESDMGSGVDSTIKAGSSFVTSLVTGKSVLSWSCGALHGQFKFRPFSFANKRFACVATINMRHECGGKM